MNTLLLVAGNCGGKSGGENRGSFEFSSASDLLIRRSFRRVNGNGSNVFRYSKVGYGHRFGVIAKVKGNKHDYPWPDDIDPNSSSGHLTYLSYFKRLTEKPKPVTLPFEKPLVDLEKRIIEVGCSSLSGIWQYISCIYL